MKPVQTTTVQMYGNISLIIISHALISRATRQYVLAKIYFVNQIRDDFDGTIFSTNYMVCSVDLSALHSIVNFPVLVSRFFVSRVPCRPLCPHLCVCERVFSCGLPIPR